MGTNGTEQSAKIMFESYSTYACVLQILKMLPKSHKPLREDGNPQTRPVVGAYSCMTSRTSEHICDLLMGMLTKHQLAGEESISTEDMCSKLEPAERKVREMYKVEEENSKFKTNFNNVSNNYKGGESVNSNVCNNCKGGGGVYSNFNNNSIGGEGVNINNVNMCDDGVHCTNTMEENKFQNINNNNYIGG